ncbi:diaminopimelate epimerase [Caldimicrobium thiodismutans]|uniref:Diaminopimelate epimerase n=1 Tax=Caldimicrobium thiodismutans TaxID=1653476 RepID=A0A0U5BXP1_9BACT|nr:diaminopimelate epimerase [Caldimicrobium thiodismutans]BAU23493.1 diaminopimelate epimerase [Caldimicrobium thiodismutans]
MNNEINSLFLKLKDETLYKVSASGNDFIVLLNFEGKFTPEEGTALAKRLCRDKFSVSADGFILIERPLHPQAHVAWKFFNRDGSIAEMCGNGARAVARLLYHLELVPNPFYLETLAGLIFCQVKGERVKVALGKPRDLKLNLALKSDYDMYLVHFVNTGVPHVVLFWEDIDTAPVEKIGPLIRYHESFKPAGTNVNFLQPLEEDGKTYLKIRTYERGVEAETLACGTGACASAFISVELGLVNYPVSVLTRSGELLIIDWDEEKEILYLEGQASLIFKFNIYQDALK